MSQTLQVTLLALLWFVYFVLHSWLASDRLKARVAERIPRAAPAYRLLYNLLATLLLIPPMSLMWLWRTETVLRWSGGWQWLAMAGMGTGLASVSRAGFLHAAL